MHTRSGECSQKEGSLSYFRLTELLLEKISSIGMGPKAGGATAAANAGVHHSQHKMCMHVKDSAWSCLEVSKN